MARAALEAGHGFTLGYWDGPADSAGSILETYLAAIPWTAEGGGYLSIKPPALRFNPRAADSLAKAAAQAGVRLHCDSHGPEAQDHTLAFAERLRRHLPEGQVSVSVPGRWRRSPTDAERLAGQGIGVRIVKGQWPGEPSRDLRQGFLEAAEAAAKTGAGLTIATHDAALAEEALQRVGWNAELEMIHGLERKGLLALATRTGRPARLYVPYGPGFAPSALRVLRNNPRLILALAARAFGR